MEHIEYTELDSGLLGQVVGTSWETPSMPVKVLDVRAYADLDGCPVVTVYYQKVA
jgi:hypothetical protein